MSQKKSSMKGRVKLPKHLQHINQYAAGIDIGSRSHFAAVPEGADEQPVREFSTFTGDLERLAEWLISCGVTTVAMESTGIYWIPVFEILENHGLEVKLVNARHVKAILGGERNPNVLAAMRDQRCKNSVATIVRSLKGNYRPEHLFSLRQAVEFYEFYQSKIVDCDCQILEQLKCFDVQDSPNDGPPISVGEALQRMAGVDLTSIDGIDTNTALKIIAEIGTDMSRWKTSKHFASWLGLSPGSKVSGGKVLTVQQNRLPTRLPPLCAWPLLRFTIQRALWGLISEGSVHDWEPPRPSPPRPISWPAWSMPCLHMEPPMSMSAKSIMKNVIGQGSYKISKEKLRNWGLNWSPYRGGPLSHETKNFIRVEASYSEVIFKRRFAKMRGEVPR